MESYHYEWRIVHDGIGKVPNVRYDAASFYYNNCIWVTCGGGSGQGKSSEVWKFDTTTKLWSRIDLPPNECPTGRDGHSGTYIGNGKFVIFGGQGFSEPNKKLGRESEALRAQTHCKRDVFNDLWVFDCNTLKWTPIYPDGLSFPMGRRGHTAIYIPKNTLSREEEERARLLKEQQRHPAAHHHHHHHGAGHHSDEASSANSYSSYGTSMGSSMTGSKQPHLSSSHAADGHASPSRVGHRHGHKDADPVYEPIPENSLVVFGGAGIELSKYTEQLYNDVWVYSFELNTWHKHSTRGMEPNPSTNHRVIRSGENMLIVGGIVGQPPELPGLSTPPASAGGNNNSNTALDGDIQVLNLRTVTWSVLRVLDHAGRPTKVGSLGFSVVPDLDLATDHLTYLPPKSILVFGGKENIDSKMASTTKQTKRQQMIATSTLPANARRLSAAQKRMLHTISQKTYAHFHADGDLLDPWSVTDDHLMLLDIEQCTLTILQTKMEGVPGGGIPVPPPEGRYAHMAVAATNPKEYEAEQEKERQQASQAGLSPTKSGRTARGGATTRRGLTSSRTARGGVGGAGDLPPELPVMYLFGGCRLENNGYCDPCVYALVKVFPPDPTARGGMLTTGRSEFSSPSPMTAKSSALSVPITNRTNGSGSPFPVVDDDFSRVSHDDHDHEFGFDTPAGLDSPSGGQSPLTAPRMSQRGGLLEQSTYSAAHASPSQAAHRTSVLESLDLLSQPSIWTNLQKKEQLNNRQHEMKSPTNWEEMKLLLTSSHSLRVVHGQVLNNQGGSHSPSVSFSPIQSGVLSKPGSPSLLHSHHGGNGGSRGMNHSLSAPSVSLNEFTFRSVASFNRGAPYSPFNNPAGAGGLDSPRRVNSGGGSQSFVSNNAQDLFQPSGASYKAPNSAGHGHRTAGMGSTTSFPTTAMSASKPRSASGSRGGTAALTGSMSALTLQPPPSRSGVLGSFGQQKPMSAQSRHLAEEARKERIQQIKTTLKPIISKQPKTIARETYNQLFPAPSATNP